MAQRSLTNATEGDQAASQPDPKRKRVTRACDQCHRGGCKCSPGTTGRSCARCETAGLTCTSNRPSKRRGPQNRRARETSSPQADTTGGAGAGLQNEVSSGPSLSTGQSQPQPQPLPFDSSGSNLSHPPVPPAPLPPAQQATAGSESPSITATAAVMAHLFSPPGSSAIHSSNGFPYEEVIPHDVLQTLVDSFYRTGYAIRPYFHWPTFLEQITQQQYRSDRALYAVTMSLCSLAAARLPDGSSVSPGSSTIASIFQQPLEAASVARKCYDAAVQAIPKKLERVTNFQYFKAKAILSATCMQTGDLRGALQHLGDYVTLSSNNGFHLEANWPPGLKEYEKQERRRLFWYMYQHDTYMATTFGGVPRHREAKTTVLYPAEVVDDEDITSTTSHIRADAVSFLRGYNYCSDLYRILEHVDEEQRARQQISAQEPGSLVTDLLSRISKPSTSECLNLISRLHEELPVELKKVKPLTGQPRDDRYGFIAANVLITTHTIKMVLVGNSNRSVHQRVAIAGELLDDLSAIPSGYINASGLTTLHHLAGVGHLLSCAIRPPLTSWTCLQVRNILLVLADYLASIEATRAAANGLSIKLKQHIGLIDQFMTQMATEGSPNKEPGSSFPPMGQGLLSRWAHATAHSHGSMSDGVSPSSIQALLNFPTPPANPGSPRGVSGHNPGGAGGVSGYRDVNVGHSMDMSGNNPGGEAQQAADQSFQMPDLDFGSAEHYVPGPEPNLFGNGSLPMDGNGGDPADSVIGSGSIADFWNNFPQLDSQDLLMAGFPRTIQLRDTQIRPGF